MVELNSARGVGRLKIRSKRSRIDKKYLSSELHDGVDDLRHVTGLEQIDGLEKARLLDTIGFGGIEEDLDVLHLHTRNESLPDFIDYLVDFKGKGIDLPA